jgi:hypothetical protein
MYRCYRLFSLCVVSCLLVACGGGGGGNGAKNQPQVIPPDATAADGRQKSLMSRFVPQLANAQAGFLYIMNPDAGVTPGVTFMPDFGAGVPANTYTFDGAYDGNGDGVSETTISSGTVTFADDPLSYAWSPLTGQATLAIDLPLIGQVSSTTLTFTATATEIRISGSGTFTNPLSGETTTIDIPAAEPIIVKPVSAASGLVANACGYNIDGSVPVQMTGSTGTLNSIWLFSPNTSMVAVQQTSFRDTTGLRTMMPDSSVTLTCGAGGSIDDWAATYDQTWVCLPFEHGRATLTLAVSNANTVTITDEDPPGSGDTAVYTATTVGASPHVVQGFFDGGEVGNTYREHFTWTLKDNDDFSDVSHYVYSEGSNMGSGGICAANARRVP